MKKPRSNGVRAADQMGRDQGVRPAIQIAAWLICVACVGLVMIVHFARARANQREAAGQPGLAATTQPAPSPRAAVARSTTTKQQSEAANQAVSSRPTRVGGFAFNLEATPTTRQWVSSLVNVNVAGGAWTDEQAAAWKENLRRLIQQGVVVVPAIREYLEQNQDVAFGPDGSKLLGYASARMAMFDALTQIGSPVSEAALDGAMQSTTDPQEIAQLAQDLEKLEPGLYQQDVLGATRQSLGMAVDGKLPGVDVAPLFQLLQQYAGADAVADLEGSANQWNYYSAIALAQLPDGAGIPSLIQIATGQQGSARTAALEMLASVASQSTAAQDALVNQVRQNNLSPYDWATLVPFLAGNQMILQNSGFDSGLGAVNPGDLRKTMVSSSNQSFYTAPLAALTTGQINQQQALVDRLLSVTTDPGGIGALQQSKALLENRLGLLASASAN